MNYLGKKFKSHMVGPSRCYIHKDEFLITYNWIGLFFRIMNITFIQSILMYTFTVQQTKGRDFSRIIKNSKVFGVEMSVLQPDHIIILFINETSDLQAL